LTHRGYNVCTAQGGHEALLLLEKQKFDLVLLDVIMPDISGFEVLQLIRKVYAIADLPIIMATARSATQDIVEALRLGANDYVQKPLNFSVVLARIETQLALKQAKAQAEALSRQLEESQKKTDELLQSSAQALLDLNTWSRSVVAEITRMLDARAVSVWIIEGGELQSITETTAPPPLISEIQSAARTGGYLRRMTSTLVPVAGLSGELFGALVIERDKALWSEIEKRLVNSFAHQLGGTLELKRMRQELTEATERKRMTRKQLLDRGVEILSFCPECGVCFNQQFERCPTDGSPLKSPGSISYTINGRYRPLTLLGIGGSGIVFEAEDQQLMRRVAVKIIKAEHFNNESMRSRFEQEARAIARINHPGVITVYDFGELEDGSLFIIMELLQGCDLGLLLSMCGPGTPSQVAQLLRNAASALSAAHRIGLIHRDLKPENIFIISSGHDFRTKLLDFGAAKEINVEKRFSQSGIIVGTPAFMSPEQIVGKPIDLRTDIYSFASVTFQALVGRPVTLGNRLFSIFVDIVLNQPPTVSSLLPGMPAQIDDAFSWALAKDPAQRPSGIEQWVESFVDILESIPPSVPGWPTDESSLLSLRRKVVSQQPTLNTDLTNLANNY
jgi:CheY-like chemotaxis protein/tRNA A-37 threonylcarbamoyl transferase component Bud32